MRNKISTHQKIILTWVVVSIWGLAFIYSSSYRINVAQNIAAYRTVVTQIVVFIALLLLLILIYRFRVSAYRFLKNTVHIQFALTFISLIIVLVIKGAAIFLGLDGLDRNGAYQVIPLIVFDFQPLEYFKITSLLFFATLVGKEGRKRTFKEITIPSIFIAFGALLVALQVDTGGFLILMTVTFILIMINGAYILKLLRYGLAATVILVILIFIGTTLGSNAAGNDSDHRVSRIESFIDPFSDPENTGLNIINSTLGISNGGLTGVGYLQSTQSSGYLFGSYSDFIFSIIAEETGLFGVLFTILILVYLSKLCFDVARNAHNRFGELYCYGYAALILVQTAVNIGGVIGMIPMTGVTLPFISNGMNSFFFLSLGLFYVVIIDLESRRRYRIQKQREDELFL